MKKSLFLLFLFCSTATLTAQVPWQFENDVLGYTYQSIDQPPVPGCTLFVGSSSFLLWRDLETVFAEYEAVNRGFGGSTFPDNLRAVERIHLPAHPARVVIFCGTNDIAGGAAANTVFNNFKFYIARIWNEHPAAEIYFVSVTHAPVREKFWAIGDELCTKVKELAEKVKGLFYIDIISPMNDENSRVRENLFVADRLHLNADGYRIWEKAIKESLVAQDKNRQKLNLAELHENRKSAGLFDDPRFAEQKITLRDDSKPVKKLNIIFIGDSITASAGIPAVEDHPAHRCANYLIVNGFPNVAYTICGVNGSTTLDFLPGGDQYKYVTDCADGGKEDKETELIFSMMFGTNDSAAQGPNGAPVSPENYRRNLKTIVDKLLTDYPAAKIVIHRPIWCGPTAQSPSSYILEEQLRLRSYFPEIDALVNYYAHSSAKEQVFLGDGNAFHYFRTNSEKMFVPEKGEAGLIFLHPNNRGADALGRFWGAAIMQVLL